jgi:hypothetical protein
MRNTPAWDCLCRSRLILQQVQPAFLPWKWKSISTFTLVTLLMQYRVWTMDSEWYHISHTLALTIRAVLIFISFCQHVNNTQPQHSTPYLVPGSRNLVRDPLRYTRTCYNNECYCVSTCVAPKITDLYCVVSDSCILRKCDEFWDAYPSAILFRRLSSCLRRMGCKDGLQVTTAPYETALSILFPTLSNLLFAITAAAPYTEPTLYPRSCSLWCSITLVMDQTDRHSVWLTACSIATFMWRFSFCVGNIHCYVCIYATPKCIQLILQSLRFLTGCPFGWWGSLL